MRVRRPRHGARPLAGLGPAARRHPSFGMLGALHPPPALAAGACAGGAAATVRRPRWVRTTASWPAASREALRTADFDALDWWVQRVPTLVDRVPPRRHASCPGCRWRGDHAGLRAGCNAPARAGRLLLAHGAQPWRALPHDAQLSPATLAMKMPARWPTPWPARVVACPLAPPPRGDCCRVAAALSRFRASGPSRLRSRKAAKPRAHAHHQGVRFCSGARELLVGDAAARVLPTRCSCSMKVAAKLPVDLPCTSINIPSASKPPEK